MLKWAAFQYRNTYNLGDEIQTIATLQFTPEPSYRIDRDFLAQFTPQESEDVAIIVNGWFSHRPENFCVQPRITPLLISLHFSSCVGLGALGISATDALRQPAMIDYLNSWGPVGARDMATYELLRDLGVNAYFSGCLTLTLQRSSQCDQQDYILCVDVPDECVSYIRRRTDRPMILETAMNFRDTTPVARFLRAQELLDLYQRAHCVVTTRLHCALPCLAYDVPVWLLDTAPDQERFRGLNELVRHCDVASFLVGGTHFDFDRPEPNSHEHLALRQELASTVRSFVTNPTSFHVSRAHWAETHYKTLWSLYRDMRVRSDKAVADLALQQSEVIALRQEVARHAHEMMDVRECAARLGDQLAAIAARHQDVLTSRSWRLTAPLRHLKGALRALGAFLRRVARWGWNSTPIGVGVRCAADSARTLITRARAQSS
jgi:hypothetical protein